MRSSKLPAAIHGACFSSAGRYCKPKRNGGVHASRCRRCSERAAAGGLQTGAACQKVLAATQTRCAQSASCAACPCYQFVNVAVVSPAQVHAANTGHLRRLRDAQNAQRRTRRQGASCQGQQPAKLNQTAWTPYGQAASCREPRNILWQHMRQQPVVCAHHATTTRLWGWDCRSGC